MAGLTSPARERSQECVTLININNTYRGKWEGEEVRTPHQRKSTGEDHQTLTVSILHHSLNFVVTPHGLNNEWFRKVNIYKSDQRKNKEDFGETPSVQVTLTSISQRTTSKFHVAMFLSMATSCCQGITNWFLCLSNCGAAEVMFQISLFQL